MLTAAKKFHLVRSSRATLRVGSWSCGLGTGLWTCLVLLDGWRWSRLRRGSGRRWCKCCTQLDLKIAYLFFLYQRCRFQAIPERAPAAFKTCERLIERCALRGGRGRPAYKSDTQKNVVERSYIAKDRKHTGDRIGRSIGIGKHRRQRLLQIAANGAYVCICFVPRCIRALPFIEPNRIERLRQGLERGLHDLRWGGLVSGLASGL